MMENKDIPRDGTNIMVTYKKEFSYGAYGSEKRMEVVTKMGFYSTLFNYIAVPPSWQYFNGVLLPHGFGGDRLQIEDIISWKPTTKTDEHIRNQNGVLSQSIVL